MSIGFCGLMEMHEWSVSEIVQISYKLIKAAMEVQCGIIMGGNISLEVYEIYKKFMDKNILLFEITDTPIDNFAEDLFQPHINMIDIKYEDEFEYKIRYNLKKVESVLKVMVESKVVKDVYIDMNYQLKEGNPYDEIPVDYFTTYVLNAYKENDFFAPMLSLKLIN